MEELIQTTHYFLREGFWHTAYLFCVDVLVGCEQIVQELSRGMDPLLVFWKSFATFKEGAVTEAIHGLGLIQSKRDLQFAVVLALAYYHRQCNIVDQEAVDKLDGQLAATEKTASEKALLVASQFLHYIGEPLKAKRLLKAAIDKSSFGGKNLDAGAFMAWVELLNNNECDYESVEISVRTLLEPKSGGNSKHIGSMMALAKVLELEKKFKDALNILNDATAIYKGFLPALIEKAKLLIHLNEWEQVTDTVQRAKANDLASISCARIQIFQLLAREGVRQQAVEEMKELIKLFDRHEPKNPELYYRCSQLFARVAGGNEFVLQKTMDMLKKSIALDPLSSAYLTEQAYQFTLLHDFPQAFQTYQKAAELDEANIDALYGMIYCRLKQNLLEDVESQLDFLTDLESSGTTAFHTFLEAMVSFRRDGQVEQSVEQLNQCLKLHIAEAKKVPIGFEFYVKLNSAFLLELAQEYLQHCLPSKKYNSPEAMPPYLIKGTKLLETLTRQTPGIIEAHMLLARAKWISGDVAAAQTALNNCMTMAPDNVEPYILSAQIHKEENNLTAAFSCLENALAENFLVREHPYFMYIKAQLEIAKKEYSQAFTTIEATFELPAVKKRTSDAKSRSVLKFGEEERAKLYVMMVEVCENLKKPDEAKRFMQKAISEFVNTPYEVLIMFANVEIAIKAGDIKKALNLLKKVQFESVYFKDARIKMADIYLHHLMDRRHYAKCYMEIVKSKESPEHYRLAGDAMMKIQEPERAIELYERALESSSDSSLVREVGRALVMTHDYQKAIQYYESALANDGKQYVLREDLAKLEMKLGNFEDAKDVIYQGLDLLEKEEKNVKNLRCQVGLLVTLVKVFRAETGSGKYGKVEGLKDEYARAIETQLIVINHVKEQGGGDILDKEKEYAAQLSYELADYLENAENDHNGAKGAYVEALRYYESHMPSLLALAKLLSKKGEFDACQMACNRLLKVDPRNEEGACLAADTLFLRGVPEQGMTLYKGLLGYKPDNYNILTKFIWFAKRLNRANETVDFIENAAKLAGRSNEPGVLFSRGIYEKIQGNHVDALKLLNGARIDQAFAKEALIQMIEIYFNLENLEWCVGSQPQQQYLNMDNIRAGCSLVGELETNSPNDPIVEVYKSYGEMFKKESGSTDQASKILSDLLKLRTNYVPGIVAFAVLKFLQKKAPDAKNILKQIQNVPYVSEEGMHIERGWLLLANYSFYNSAIDLAKELCGKCLKYNRANQNAEELMGLVKEKTNLPSEAIVHYENAWKLSNHTSATIGYTTSTQPVIQIPLEQYLPQAKEKCSVHKDMQGIAGQIPILSRYRKRGLIKSNGQSENLIDLLTQLIGFHPFELVHNNKVVLKN
eukprot:TRINITY_DN4_c0_g4_i1.p1 TRINITY_DN4_c0_g4~~TRINITY_DN4_c0_g4_i1.p1  ORF type:complete len:1365 (-),score=175.90 TRINITY_DN4_c0_g4_i1:25171-29265(-)